ncbi:MAG TPA: N-acetyl-gamma-glutamyl-phosphate reductase [Ardenticatenaceae bacterium]|nr:N-acetyl-gamma-glutamyl-phosphate reductase [Ardenticatenaceae bacterium]
MIRAGVVGATGYTGFETIKILARHPSVEIAFATARSDAGKLLGDLFATPLDVRLQRLEDVDLEAADVLFLCLPHGAAQAAAAAGLAAGCKVVDLSADFRLRDPDSFRHWYGEEHRRPELLAEAVYGLTEWRRDEIRNARLIANPGCYPTSILLALAPLLRAGLLGDEPIIADSKSGVSGAGRGPKVGSLFSEVSENFKPYNIGHSHRHVAEIEQELASLSGGATRRLLFSPHLLPVVRGILSTIYVPLPAGWSEAQLRALYAEAYAGEPFVWLLPAGQSASLAHAVNTNRCALSLHPVPEAGRLILVSTIDNLVKGAAGQAVQNCNVMFGLDETAGLVG